MQTLETVIYSQDQDQENVPSSAPRRRGRTLERCLVIFTILGGMWIGFELLGHEPQAVAQDVVYDMLVQTEMLEKLPKEWQPEPVGEEGEKAPSSAAAKQFQLLKKQLQEIIGEASGTSVADSGISATKINAMSEKERQELAARSLDSWDEMALVIKEEAALQQELATAVTQLNGSKVFTLRSQAAKSAAEALSHFSKGEVDYRVSFLANRLSNWYYDCSSHFDTASLIWATSSSRRVSPQRLKEWKIADSQLRNEYELFGHKSELIQELLVEKYNLEFTALIN